MVPTPQELSSPRSEPGAAASDGERVVISGMSGLYPKSHHVKDLADILYNKKNPVTCEDSRWKYDHPEVVQFGGKVPDLDLFDAQFFKVHYLLGNSMDSMSRKILEQAYQAIYDAGVSPEHLYGKKVGVYVGSCFSETEKTSFYTATTKTGFGIAGCNKSMFANRISYWLNAKGPSMSVDAACCSSAAAVELAHLAITRGDCEAAIVGGASLCLHPQSSIHYGRILKMSKEGTTKSFDNNACGCARSEAINVLFLQKAKDARRVYAEIVHIKTEFTANSESETGLKYGFYRDPLQITGFLNQFYKEAKVPTQAIEYIEAFGSAAPDTDKAELEAIENVFCGDRKDPLLVGSVMSNIGYVEAASGISAITKVLLGYHTGKLAANLHCDTPRRDIAALQDGRMQIVTEHQPFCRTYVAVNGLSITGINAHVLLNGHYKPKDLTRYQSNIPHLVTISGRQESSVKLILEDLKSRPIDPEELALFHNIHQTRIFGHLGRGYTILDKNEDNKTISLSEKVDYFDFVKRPLWFVYSGMGSQWAGMGVHLMRIPIFAAAIERCRRVLEPKGVDIVHVITSPDKKIFDNILNSFVGIAAIQIGLTDILRELGLEPDKIIGHSVGELGCAYADGCFTAEEMILSAYSRGLVSVQTPFIRGSMAAVGIGFQQISTMCPPEIEVACHNGPDSCTISGPADIMREFVAQLTSKNIFAKEVPCSNIAYHSRYIAEAGPGLLKYLKEVIKTPKLRSERWVSTSVPMENWNKPSAMYSSADYHTNNLLNPVLFEETSRLIPADAVLIEVAPHGLLQAILKRSLPDTCRNIALTRRGHPDNTRLVLDAVGQLFMEGYNPKVHVLYPKIEFPVSAGTPMLSHLIEWAHHEKWSLPLYSSAHRKHTASTKFVISLYDPEHNYLQGSVIQDKTLYPCAAVLVAVWDTLAMVKEMEKKQMSVQFDDVHLHAQPVLHERRQLRLSVALHRGTGRFEVMDEHSKVASGYIKCYSENDSITPTEFDAQNFLDMNSIYQMLFLRDYSYSGEFRSIHSADTSLTKARILWHDNWVTFIDGLLQLNALNRQHGTVSQPDFIRKLVINVDGHSKDKSLQIDNKTVKIADIYQDMTRCGGVHIENIRFRDLPIPDCNKINLKALKFIPHFSSEVIDIPTALHIYLQIIEENIPKHSIKILEITDGKPKFGHINGVIDTIPGINSSYMCLEKQRVLNQRSNFVTDVDVLLVSNLSADDDMCQMLYRVLPRDTYLINMEDSSQNPITVRPVGLYRVVCSHNITKSAVLELARWRPINTSSATSTLSVCTHSDLDLLSATQASLPPRQKLLVLTAYPPLPGLKDLIKTWRKENDRKIYLIMINHKISEDQNFDQMPNLELAFNILDHGRWGGEYYLSLQENTKGKGNVMLRSARMGDLNSLHWAQAPQYHECDVKVKVHYAGINDLDVNTATGMISSDYSKQALTDGYGMDFSGVTVRGDRVMGLVQHGAVRSNLHVDPDQLWPVPEHWSLEDAATVPLAYCLAYYSLAIKTELYPGMSILVHGGTGALGQAAISIALSLDCEVFATVRDVNKKAFLLKMFPNLKAENIGNSRDVTFGDMIMTATNGQGVHVILCCVKGELKSVSLRCGTSNSAIIDVVQIQTRENYDFGMNYMNRERNYVRTDLNSVFTNRNSSEMKKLHRLVSDGIALGVVRPLSRVTYAPNDVSRAFRLLAASHHRGRVLLNLQQQGDQLPVQPRLHCSPDLHHFILCDDDYLAQQLIEKLISRGVRKLRLHRLKPSFDFQLQIRRWETSGIEIKATYEDAANHKNIFEMIGESLLTDAVEGIYVILTGNEKSANDLPSHLTNLDAVTIENYPNLKYFGIVSTSSSIGAQAYILRQQRRLPATMIQLPAIRKMEDALYPASRGNLSVRSAIDAVEQALCSTETILMAHINNVSKPSIFKQLATLADINIPNAVDTSKTLSDLGLNGAGCKTVQTLLRDVFNIALTEGQIPELTIKKLLDIEKTFTKLEWVNKKGLKTFFSHVVSDELLATAEMVILPTLSSGTTKRSDEFDVNETHLCIVPGMEGHHQRFKVLCERLKLPALVLQPGVDCPEDTVRDRAQKYAKMLLEKTALKTNYYLLGYESGVIVALELAAVLEEHGLTGTVFCIGSPPDEFSTELREQLNEFATKEALQDGILRHMFTLMSKSGTQELDAELQKCKSWDEKLETTVHTLLGRVSHSAQYARQLIEAARSYLLRFLEYKPEVKVLRSKLVLLYPTPAAAGHSARTALQSLQQHSQQPVVVHELQTPLAHAAEDLRCAALINNHLDKSILEDFEKKNLCDSFLLNANSFMTSSQAQS